MREQNNVGVVENVHLFADRRQRERSNSRRRGGVRNVDDLQAAELIEKVKGVTANFPDVRLGNGTRRGGRAVVCGGSRAKRARAPGTGKRLRRTGLGCASQRKICLPADDLCRKPVVICLSDDDFCREPIVRISHTGKVLFLRGMPIVRVSLDGMVTDFGVRPSG